MGFIFLIPGDSSVILNTVTKIDNVFGSEPTRATTKPYFDDIFARNVSAIVGQSAVLNCRVKHVGDRTVSMRSYFSYFQHPYCASN